MTVTSKGQVTLRRAVLNHLGVAPGDRVEVELLPDGRAALHAVPKGSIENFIGCLRREGTVPLSIEQMNEIIADAWAGKR